MSAPEKQYDSVIDDLRSSLRVLAAEPIELPDDVRQQLMRCAVTSFASAWEERRVDPLASASDITATAAVVTASGLTRALNIELFELAMWQTQAGA